MSSHFGVGFGHRLRCLVCPIVDDQYCTRFSVSPAIHTDDHAIVDRRLCAKRSFEVLGIDIHPLSGDDYVLLTPFEIKIAGLVQGTQVVRGNRLAIHPIGLRDTVATDKDLARFVEFDLASGQGFAYRSATELEGMIQAH